MAPFQIQLPAFSTKKEKRQDITQNNKINYVQICYRTIFYNCTTPFTDSTYKNKLFVKCFHYIFIHLYLLLKLTQTLSYIGNLSM